MSRGDEQSDDKFDVEEVDRNTTELPLYESGGEDEVEDSNSDSQSQLAVVLPTTPPPKCNQLDRRIGA
ncbi:hypothetical protein BpHYR1_008979 [Brachionus plicatilis]|uniref:Uncharacterized protein n=1 Tax=Brachionus plicatilis TaxID=10195 RepID=A0A3M7RLC2_BRAPC|nr:hypothetical protein BpHYR1_008979 [Brachionus plicatilis]